MTRVLFVCGKARKRSPTAAAVARRWGHVQADFAGLSKDADEPLTPDHLQWAQVIMVMERRQRKRLSALFGPPPARVKVVVLDIADDYEFMDRELTESLEKKLAHHFGPPGPAPRQGGAHAVRGAVVNLVRAGPDTDWEAVRQLIADAFAYMEPRLGHPSRATQVTAACLARAAQDGSCWLIVEGDTPLACLFTRRSRDHAGALYLGMLAVADAARGRGLARHLVKAAATEARRAGYNALTLDTGEAFPELHATFARLGFGPPLPRAGEPGVVTLTRPL